jgi:hypothetical protein
MIEREPFKETCKSLRGMRECECLFVYLVRWLGGLGERRIPSRVIGKVILSSRLYDKFQRVGIEREDPIPPPPRRGHGPPFIDQGGIVVYKSSISHRMWLLGYMLHRQTIAVTICPLSCL